jgi:hypothetical protein
VINILNEGLCRFVPVLRETAVHNELSEEKTCQAIDGRYLKECSLTDTSTWSAVAAKKEDADFKILRIRNSPTVSADLDFIIQWDLMRSAEHLVFYKKPGHRAFLCLKFNSN